MSEVAIKLEGISKKYTIGKEKDGSLRGTLSSLFSKSTSSSEDFWALKNVSFEVKKGDVVGIIGKNGAGKSTLLKILSQITRPTEGKIEINGRIASLLEVGTGFHPELTGRENIFLNGTILGMTRKEVQSKFDEIVAFSGIEKFIDTPVKHYSSGMYVRLAFAVAAHLEPEILIIDEVLAVGDAEFQKKCLGKMKDVAGEGRTVLFVSHNLLAVQELCNKAIVLKNGKIMFEGSSYEGIDCYRNESSLSKTNFKTQKDFFKNEQIEIKNIEIKSINGYSNLTIDSGVEIYIDFKNNIEKKNLAVSLFIKNEDDILISEIGCIVTNENDSKKTNYRMKIKIPPFTLNAGTYTSSIIFAENQRHIIFRLEDFMCFEIINIALGNTFTKLPGILALSGNTFVEEIEVEI